MVARSTLEAKYRSMALTLCEVMWLKQFLKDLGMKKLEITSVLGGNQVALAITVNPVHHERTKHVEMSFHRRQVK